MKRALLHFIKISWPFHVFILLVIGIFLIDEPLTSVLINAGVSESTVANTLIVIRALLSVGAVFFLVLPGFRDYSEYFGSDYSMRVYYDQKGLEKELSKFSKYELQGIVIPENWIELRKQYFEKLAKDIQNELGVEDFHFGESKYVSSSGECSFVAEKVEGWQAYQIASASGQLTHRLEKPHETAKKFNSSFELMGGDESSRYIHASILDIYFRFTKVIAPLFKQTGYAFGDKPDSEKSHESLIALTKLRFFPFLRIERTVYLNQLNEEEYYPVAYAVLNRKKENKLNKTINIGKIFISYRRRNIESVRNIKEALIKRYGNDSVFFDIESIHYGDDFPQEISESLQSSSVCLAVIGNDWLNHNSDGKDWVFTELELAAQRKIPIIPIMLSGAKMPKADDLPENMQFLVNKHGAPFDSGEFFSHTIDNIFQRIEKVCQ